MTDSQKIKEYLNPIFVTHKQVIITGNKPNKKKFKIICDEGIAPLIRKINTLGIHTLWSCQGDNSEVAYLAMSPANLSVKRLEFVDSLVKSFWKGKYIETTIFNGNICYYAYTKRQYIAYLKYRDMENSPKRKKKK